MRWCGRRRAVGLPSGSADIARIDVVGALRRLLDEYPEVRVESIGVQLGLPARCRHDAFVPFGELPKRIGAWDIGIAPLAELPGNRVRSDIKVKEYSTSGVPWLASPVGPCKKWAKRQTIEAVADRWERVCLGAAESAN